MIKQQKRANLEQKIQSMENDLKNNNSHNLFKTVRQLEGKRKKAISAIKDKEGTIHTNADKILECWSQHFCNHLNTRFPHDQEAENSVPDPPNNVDKHPEISMQEVQNAVKRMKLRKAPGVDNITAEVLRAGNEPMCRMLHKIFNLVWQQNKTPKDWAKMLVTPIYKKGDKLDPANYRAISLLSIPGKVFCKILLDRMKQKAEEALSESQFGFRPGRGTVDAIFIVRQLIEKAKEHRVQLHFNFVDFKAAFDTIWRKALWKMMLAIGIDPKIINIIEDMYNNTECAVVIEGQLTDWFTVQVGVRQGCLLSPVLFNIFLEFVMKDVTNINNTLLLNKDLSNEIRYADDTTLISCIFEKLNLMSESLDASCKKWGMKVNPSKCKILSPTDRDISMGDQIVLSLAARFPIPVMTQTGE